MVDPLTVDSRVAFRLRDESSSRGEAYVWDKTPQQDFALKMQGAYARGGGGGRMCGTLQYLQYLCCERVRKE